MPTTSPALRRVALAILDDVTMVSGAIVGTAAGRFTYSRTPDRYGPVNRLAAGVAAGLVAAVITDSLLGMATRPVRCTHTQDRPATTTPAASVDEVRPRIAEQAALEAEHQAKTYWYWRSPSAPGATDNLWHGYDDGTATYFLAPGLYLRYQPDHNTVGTKHSLGWQRTYTLESGQGTTPLTGPAHLLELLTVDDQDEAPPMYAMYDEPPF
ncbi:hypothetical protein ACFC34_38175 [Streptomyces sp. NPDC056053]|uniref:hypothetical protein n=1 Tax=Streptomyces sp. NPDC056053 TaxID=3345696 RepID=UPI0035DB6FAF